MLFDVGDGFFYALIPHVKATGLGQRGISNGNKTYSHQISETFHFWQENERAAKTKGWSQA
jgi:hypothetical protein